MIPAMSQNTTTGRISPTPRKFREKLSLILGKNKVAISDK